MPERFEKFPIEKKPESIVEKKPEEIGLILLKEEIKEVIQEYSAETFEKAKKEKTKEIPIVREKGIEAIMREYPSREKNFREFDWFKKLTPEEKERNEFEIISFIHKTAKQEITGLHNEFFEKLSPEVQEYFKENRRREKENKEKLLPPKELEEGVIKSIQEFEKQFGFLPGSPETLAHNCAGFTNFLGKLFEHYGFKSGPVNISNHTGHTASLVELKGNKKYVSDVNFPEPLLFKEWIEMIGEVMKRKIKIRDITPGYFGGYEGGVHLNLGRFLKKLKRYDEAEKEFKEAIRINPNDVSAHVNLGNLVWVLERFPEAENEFREALKINPNYAGAHQNLGLLYKEMGKIDEAREELLKARELFEKEGRKEGRIDYVKKCDGTLKEIST